MKHVLLSSSIALVFAAASAHAAGPCVAAADRAQDLRVANKLRAARAELLTCSASTCNAVVRADCERWLREVDAQTPSLVVRVVDARGRDVVGAHVTLDDNTAVVLDGSSLAVDPGTHVVRAHTDGGDSAQQKIAISLGEKSRGVEVRFDASLEEDGSRSPAPPPPRATISPVSSPPPAPSGGSLVVPIVLGSIGVAALGAFGWFEVTGESAYRGLENGCGRTRSCTDADTDPVRAKFVGASVALGVSAVALGAAVVAVIVAKSGSSTTPAARVAPNGIRF
jgi:hypothetical protein